MLQVIPVLLLLVDGQPILVPTVSWVGPSIFLNPATDFRGDASGVRGVDRFSEAFIGEGVGFNCVVDADIGDIVVRHVAILWLREWVELLALAQYRPEIEMVGQAATLCDLDSSGQCSHNPKATARA